MPKRKSFIDKKKSVAFRLVHRSQKDPLIAADDRNLVLAPIDGVERLSIQENRVKKSVADIDYDKRQERVKYGIYFDDDYDYLQHLKDVNEVYELDGVVEQRFRVNKDGTTVEAGRDIPIVADEKSRLALPPSLFESKGIELRTGLLNQAAPLPGPHPELDPDIVAALDDDSYDFSDPDNQLEDDFMLKANASSTSCEDSKKANNFARPRNISASDFDEDQNSGSDSDNEDDEEDGSKHEWEFDCGSSDRDRGLAQAIKFARDRFAEADHDETKSRFTNYSLTSSVMRRSAGLKCVDAVFEKLYEQYDEDELGELTNEDNEIIGFIKPESQRVQQMIEEYEDDIKKAKLAAEELINDKESMDKAALNSDDESEKSEDVYVQEKAKERWDCESFLSTYSTLYNHPTVICEPSRKRAKLMQLDPKTGLPSGVLRQNNLAPILAQLPNDAANELSMEIDNRTARTRASTIRSKFETTEQRKARKDLIKEERRERRKEKKINKMAFRSEGLRVKKQEQNVKHNLSGVRLV